MACDGGVVEGAGAHGVSDYGGYSKQNLIQQQLCAKSTLLDCLREGWFELCVE